MWRTGTVAVSDSFVIDRHVRDLFPLPVQYYVLPGMIASYHFINE